MKKIIIGLVVLFGMQATAAMNVVTSTTDLAWMAKEIGKELVDVSSLTRGTENLHFIDTVPDYIRKVADAQVVCFVGFQLEVGWIPKVVAKSGNAQVQPGGKGYCDTSKTVQVLEKPQGAVDRSMGDIHPGGNPHYWLSPVHLAQGGQEMMNTFIRVDPAHTAEYEKNYKEFVQKMDKLEAETKAKVATVVGKFPSPQAMEYHKEFTYFFNAYGITSMGSLEEKPGVPPSAGRIAEVSLAAKEKGVRVLMAAPYSQRNTVARFTELSGLPVEIISPCVVAADGLDYIKYHHRLVDSFLKHFEKTAPAKKS